MTYIVTRTSDYSNKTKPCEEAFKKPIYNRNSKSEEKVWVVEMNSLEEFNKFVNKYSSVVVEVWYSNNSYLSIEIYDNWRE